MFQFPHRKDFFRAVKDLSLLRSLSTEIVTHFMWAFSLVLLLAHHYFHSCKTKYMDARF